jgi:hypothetical protein
VKVKLSNTAAVRAKVSFVVKGGSSKLACTAIANPDGTTLVSVKEVEPADGVPIAYYVNEPVQAFTVDIKEARNLPEPPSL